MDRVGTDPEHQVDTGCVYTDPDNQYHRDIHIESSNFRLSSMKKLGLY